MADLLEYLQEQSRQVISQAFAFGTKKVKTQGEGTPASKSGCLPLTMIRKRTRGYIRENSKLPL